MTKFTPETAKRLLEKILSNITPDIDFKKIETIEADIYLLENLEMPDKETKLYKTTTMTAKNLRILLTAARKNRTEFGTAKKRIETSTPPPKTRTKEEIPNATQALDLYEKELLEHEKFIKTATKPYEKAYNELVNMMRKEIISLIRKLQE
jgi:hypothetical protein